jgi:D-beta-D-heptose 7-phosphate kinase/D-beta-D-heptose 1-phosphate adenosyltransferase
MTTDPPRVLVIGDVMLDRYVHGRVDRISPEAPVPVLRFEREELVLGGAGNVHRNVRSLGAGSALLTALGDDDAGRRVEELLRSSGATVTGERKADRTTTVKIRYMADGHQLLRQDVEEAKPIDSDTLRELCGEARRRVADGCRGVVVLSDYGKGVLSLDRAAEFIAAVRSDAFIIVDPSGDDAMRYVGADLLKPNRRELELLSGMRVADVDGAVAAARTLISRIGCGYVLATLGADGMVLVSASEGKVMALSSRDNLTSVDVTGAGDTVAAAIAVWVAEGRSFDEGSLRFAFSAATVAVSTRGTVAVWRSKVDELRSLAIGESIAEVDVVDKVHAWRSAGLRVGFVNGCFDVIHPGHFHLLREARKQCDRLVVAVNSDASVRRLKGDRRPVQAAETRSAVLIALRWVDLVAVFDEDTPLELIEAVRPDVIFKGSDYTIETTVGANLVDEVVFVPLLPGHSTTATLEAVAAE